MAGARLAHDRGQRGAALLTALTVLAVLGIIVSLLFDRARPGVKSWSRENARMQALYLAESGIGHQLYLERWSDSADPAFGPAKEADTASSALGDFLGGGKGAAQDTFVFRFAPDWPPPDVRVDRTRAYLDMTSTGTFKGETAVVRARFGKALDDSIFGPALTLDNDIPLEPIQQDQIYGNIRLRTASQGVPSLPWPGGLSVQAYTAEFVDRKYYALESALQKKLTEEGQESGNGNFEPGHPPDFARKKDWCFPLGKVEFRNDDDETWVIRGPGRIYADGEIRLKGRIRLEKIQLLSGKEITLEDSVTGEETTLYARASIFMNDRTDMEVEAVAGKDIILRDKAQTRAGSVLLSVGGKQAMKAGDSTNAVRIVNEARARGFLIAGGANGRVALATPLNRVEGVVMAGAVWLGGSVHGPVLASKLLCEGTQQRNCLGPGRIDRSRLPQDFVQPLQLGPSDRRTYRFKLMDWKLL
jgi:hypothetical protein